MKTRLTTDQRSRLVTRPGSQCAHRLPAATGSPARSEFARRGGLSADSRSSLSAFRSSSAFTLVELLVVIGIIVILIGILIPVVGAVRKASYGAKTQQIISQLSTAIEAYYQDNRAYPGPVPNGAIGVPAASLIMLASAPATAVDATNGVTMSENLYLGLSGGIGVNAGVLVFDDSGAQLGKGPHTLGAGPNQNRLHAAYVDNVPTSWTTSNLGHFVDQVAGANDTIIPEYLDGYPQPLPILYMRAATGGQYLRQNPAGTPIPTTPANNDVITLDGFIHGPGVNPPLPSAQYGLNQIIGYTGTAIGEGKDKSKLSLYNGQPATFPPNPHGLQMISFTDTTIMGAAGPVLPYRYPYNAYAYFGNPAFYNAVANPPYPAGTFSQPRQKDGYILISAGPDRIYGTEDDVCSFGSFNFAK